MLERFALDLGFWQVVALVMCAIVGCFAAAGAHRSYRRVYRLSGSMSVTSDFLSLLLRGSVAVSLTLFYVIWMFDWLKSPAANLLLSLLGSFVFALAFGLTYWLSGRVISCPEPLPVAYRFTKEELSLHLPLHKQIFWPACLTVVLGMEILERKVFGNIAVVREPLNIGGTFFLSFALLANAFVKMPYYRAVDQLNNEIKAREVAARSLSVTLAESAESAR